MKLHSLLFLSSILVLFSCGSDDDNDDTTVDDLMPTIDTEIIVTSDAVDIHTIIKKPVELTSPAPAVVFVHSNAPSPGKTEWTTSSLYNKIFEEGYIVVAFDFRTYGFSGTDGGTQFGLLNEQDRATLDLEAVVEFLQNDSDIDNSRIGVIGSKLGAEVALAAAGNDDLNIKTTVSFSALKTSVQLFSADNSNFQLQSVFYIAGENEASGAQAADAQLLFNETNEPRKITIPVTQNTGIDLILTVATLEDDIVNWIKDNL